MKKFKLTYGSAIKALLATFCCLLITNSVVGYKVFGVSVFVAFLYLGMNPLTSSVIFLISQLYGFEVTAFFSASVVAVMLCPAFLLFKAKKIKIGAKIIPISIFAITPYVLINGNDFTIRLITGGVSVAFTFIAVSALRVLFIKRFRYKTSIDELVCLSAFTFAMGLGFINVLGFNVYRSLVIFIILSIGALFGAGTATVSASVLAFAPSLLSLNLNWFAAFTIISVISVAFYDKSKFVSALVALAGDVLSAALLKLYGAFSYMDVLYAVVPVSLFIFLPNTLFISFKKKVYSLSDKMLPRHAVNRMRLALSGKLYGVAGVFGEMKLSFDRLKNTSPSSDELINRMADEIIISVCESCPSYSRCKQKGYPDRNELIKILMVGVAKNRVSLIDLTKKFASECGYVNSVIFEMNSLITKYSEKVKEVSELSSGKELITMQSSGVQGVLKELALGLSKTINFDAGIESTVGNALHKAGVTFLEIMALGEGEDLEISLVTYSNDYEPEKLIKIVSEATKKPMNITEKTSLSLTLTAVTLNPAPKLDAAFGLASNKKNGSQLSGDTHSLVRIDEGKFLIALSDGMGSGKEALETSGAAISLIESFYKAGLDSDVVLGMVNKVLALGTDDSFSAMDILTINLFNMTADLIKIGSPSSFIMTDESIKVIDGSSLPLGILDDLKPTGSTFKLEEGATVMMVTDGISDAFGSSTDLINYLKILKNRNPQIIADDVLKRALSLDNELAKDDMTVICVRIFKKAS